MYEVGIVESTAYSDQNLGTSGLRKKTRAFLEQRHYTENFIQATINTVFEKDDDFFLVIGGDGRYYCEEAAKLTIKIAAANGIRKIHVAKNCIFSTPAVSHYVRKHKASGALIFTASHNPGGENEDFGIKYNIGNGGPAPEKITSVIFENTKIINSFLTLTTEDKLVDLSTINDYEIKVSDKKNNKNWTTKVSVIDAVSDYMEMLREIFDFSYLIETAKKLNFKILLDGLNGVTGPYLSELEKMFGGAISVQNGSPLPDFGGSHPDPNLTYAKSLVDALKGEKYDLGAAFDGDGDRNMILGKNGFFLTPSDSVAVLAANAVASIPYFKKNTKLYGVARSMPTSSALDQVAKKLNLDCFVVPTGWKFFGNLMDAQKISICGEESFGTGSDHIREKDGVWAFLSVLSVVLSGEEKNLEKTVLSHWKTFGRNYYSRYDYENCETEKGKKVYDRLYELVVGKNFLNNPEVLFSDEVEKCESFEYTDSVDNSRTVNQGLRFAFKNGDVFILRVSGTGSSGITLRLYFDRYIEQFEQKDCGSVGEVLKELIEKCLKMSQVQELTGRNAPSVIT